MLNTFKLVDAGKAKWILGTAISQDDEGIILNQQKYTKDMLTKYNMINCNLAHTPIIADNHNTTSNNTITDPVDRTNYSRKIGSLIYASTVSRPDISFAVSKVSQKIKNPSPEDKNKVNRIFRYLKGTQNTKLHYRRNGNAQLIGFSDSDWAGNDKRKSTSGYVFMLAGSAISWKSKKQDITALSSCEAEYIAGSSAAQEALFLKQILTDLKYEIQLPITLYIDNQSAIKIAQNQVISNRSKHIDVKYHSIRELVQQNIIKLKYIPSRMNLADMLTKPVGKIILADSVKSIFTSFNHEIEGGY
jgi:hypothetical protein